VLLALALLAFGRLHWSPVELELAGGVAHSLERAYETDYPRWTPMVQGRLGVGLLDHLSLGGSFLAVLGGEAPNKVACCGTDSGNQAFKATAGFVSLRLHSGQMPQYWVEAGLGPGHLISLQTESAFEHPPLRGRGGLCARIAAGLRWTLGQNGLLGAELAWIRWSNVEQAAGFGSFNAPAQSGLSTTALLFLASVGFSIAP
jgi:hypothetical protein